MADIAAPYYYGKYLWQRVLILPGFWLIVAFTSLDYLEHTMLQVSRKQNAVLVALLTLIVGEYQLLLNVEDSEDSQNHIRHLYNSVPSLLCLLVVGDGARIKV